MTTTRQRIEALERGRGQGEIAGGVIFHEPLEDAHEAVDNWVAAQRAAGRRVRPGAGFLVTVRPMSEAEWSPLVVAGQQRLMQRAEHYAQHGVDPIPDPPPFG